MLAIAATTSIETITAVCNSAAPGSAEHKRAFEVWNKLSANQLPFLTDPAKAKSAYHNAPPESTSRGAIWKKWNELSIEEVRAATDYWQTIHAISRAPSVSRAQKLGFEKLIGFCTTLEQYRDAYSDPCIGFNPKKLALENWSRLVRSEIDSAQDTLQVLAAIARALPGSDDEKYGYQKLIVAATIPELWGFHERAPRESKQETFFYDALCSRALDAVQKAKSRKALLEILEEGIPEDSPALDLYNQKMEAISMKEVVRADTLLKLKRAHKRALAGGPAEKLAVQKIAALLPDD